LVPRHEAQFSAKLRPRFRTAQAARGRAPSRLMQPRS